MATAAPAPGSLTTIAERVDLALSRLLDAERARWVRLDPDLARPVEEIARLVLAGGKRLRPAFCHWGWIAAGGDPDADAIVRAGAALELMHAFALFHDDVMDDAVSRRGIVTTHTTFGAEHASRGWNGEARRFGEGVAILVGDLAFVYSDQLLAGASPAAWAIWNELRLELNVGQFLDIVGTARSERRLEQAERIARYKSGKYTIERPLHLGAVLADERRGTELLPVLSEYGLPLGDAFQMRDDVIGAFGDSSVTGKPVGNDLREGKPTPLLARAVASADPAQKRVLDAVGRPGMTAREIADAQQVIVDTGALAALEHEISRLTALAIRAIEPAAVPEAARIELVELAHFVSSRQI